VTLNIRTDRIFPGMGQTLRNDPVLLIAGIALSGTGQQSNTIPASGSLALTTTCGRIRCKIYNGSGTSPTVVDLVVTAGDGTNAVTIAQGLFHPNAAVTLSATSWFEAEFEYIVDTAASGAGGGASGQLSGTVGGANVITFKTTLGGTSPAASMDVELCPLI